MGHIALAFSPDGTTLAASGRGTSVNLWDTATWALRRVLEGRTASVNDADFSPDGQLLATACDDGTIRLWDVGLGTAVWTIQGHQKAASTVAFAPDGRRVASGGEDQKAKVWDVTTGEQLASFSGHSNRVLRPGVRTRRPHDRFRRRHVSRARRRRGQALGFGDRHGDRQPGRAHQPGQRRGLLSRRPAPRHRQRRPDDQALGYRHARRCFHTTRAHQRRRQPGHQPRRPPDRLGEHRLLGQDLEHGDTRSRDGAELSLRRAAVERVQSLLARHLLKADVLEALRAEKSLSPPLRAAALEIAERRTENASGLYQAGWLAVLRPGRPARDYRLAVRRLEAACQVVADDPERLAQYSVPSPWPCTGRPARAGDRSRLMNEASRTGAIHQGRRDPGHAARPRRRPRWPASNSATRSRPGRSRAAPQARPDRPLGQRPGGPDALSRGGGRGGQPD